MQSVQVFPTLEQLDASLNHIFAVFWNAWKALTFLRDPRESSLCSLCWDCYLRL